VLIRFFPAISFSLLLGASLHAGDGKPVFDKVSAEDVSPQRGMLVEHRSARDGADQIWLVSTADPAQRRLLFTHERHASVLFSPDEEWLVINDHRLSNESRLLLFHRKAGLEYEQTADLTDAAWKFFDESNGLKKPNPFDHSYVDALRWASEEQPVLLLCLEGHLDSRNRTAEWYCLYDIGAKRFSTDLDAHNRAATKLEEK
jgi:hypothetical protein